MRPSSTRLVAIRSVGPRSLARRERGRRAPLVLLPEVVVIVAVNQDALLVEVDVVDSTSDVVNDSDSMYNLYAS